MEHYELRVCETEGDLAAAFAIRKAVFIVEQHIDPELERDGLDEEARHFLAFADGEAVAAARLHYEGERAKLGRMAVLSDFRRQGVGRDLLRFILKTAKAAGVREVYLDSQNTARAFYFARGFSEFGEPFIEAGIPHISMSIDLDDKLK